MHGHTAQINGGGGVIDGDVGTLGAIALFDGAAGCGKDSVGARGIAAHVNVATHGCLTAGHSAAGQLHIGGCICPGDHGNVAAVFGGHAIKDLCFTANGKALIATDIQCQVAATQSRALFDDGISANGDGGFVGVCADVAAAVGGLTFLDDTADDVDSAVSKDIAAHTALTAGDRAALHVQHAAHANIDIAAFCRSAGGGNRAAALNGAAVDICSTADIQRAALIGLCAFDGAAVHIQHSVLLNGNVAGSLDIAALNGAAIDVHNSRISGAVGGGVGHIDDHAALLTGAGDIAAVVDAGQNVDLAATGPQQSAVVTLRPQALSLGLLCGTAGLQLADGLAGVFGAGSGHHGFHGAGCIGGVGEGQLGVVIGTIETEAGGCAGGHIEGDVVTVEVQLHIVAGRNHIALLDVCILG